MGLRDRFKSLVKAQVRKRMGTFSVRSGPMPPPRSGADSAPAGPNDPVNFEPPKRREIVRVERLPDPVVDDALKPIDGVAIKARPSRDGEDCTFLVDRVLFDAGSWHFGSVEEAAGSPLAEALFAFEGVTEVVIDESTATVSIREVEVDWAQMAAAIGAAIRTHVTSGAAALDPTLAERIPDETALTARLQALIDDVINPGVAAHDGHISLSKVRANSVYVTMGGGCQGCSAAAVTLKQGIHATFRDHVPEVGAIYDDTDHAAGLNPWLT